jgi:thiamine pyrophosphokinase
VRVIVVAPGATDVGDHHRAALAEARLVIAVDGGLGFALRTGLAVDAVIGDMDSVAHADLEHVAGNGALVLRHRQDKDETDLQLALDLALSRGATAVDVLGGFGGRWDHTFANSHLPMSDRYRSVRIRAVAGTWCAEWLNGPGAIVLDACVGDTVSLIPLSPVATGIWSEGLKYSLAGDDLAAGSTRGVSNRAEGASPGVRLGGGTLMCVTLHEMEELK